MPCRCARTRRRTQSLPSPQPTRSGRSLSSPTHTQPPTTSKPKTGKPTAVSDQLGLQDQGLQERQHTLTCSKLVLIGIATIVISAALYALAKSYESYSDGSAPEDRVQSSELSELWLASPWFMAFMLLAFWSSLLVCAYGAIVMLDGKKAVEAERVLQELCRNTKSDASLAIPVVPFTRGMVPDVGQDSDCLDIDWVPPVGGGATAYHLQWREQQEQEWTEWASSVASEKIGVPYCTKGSLRTHTAYQFRVRAFSAISERRGPWSPPSEPTTVHLGKVRPCSPSHAPARSMHPRTLQSPSTGPTFHRLTSPCPCSLTRENSSSTSCLSWSSCPSWSSWRYLVSLLVRILGCPWRVLFGHALR